MIWRAALLYGLFAFGLGFLLGTLRVLLIVPALGEAAAVMLELPVMLAACWWCAGWIVRRYRPLDRGAALAIGLIGFAVLMVGELAVGVSMFGLTPAGWISGFTKPTAQLGLVAQLLAAAMPLLHARRLPRA
jgi:hypothetical protein